VDNPWNNGQASAGGGGSNSGAGSAGRRSNMGLSSDVPNGKFKITSLIYHLIVQTSKTGKNCVIKIKK